MSAGFDERSPRVVIVGSGPSGISAAWPLVERGIEVLMLDASANVTLPRAPASTIGELRRGVGHSQVIFGDHPPLRGSLLDRSPKTATPLTRAATAGYHEALGLNTRGFFALGSLAAGGLSNVWGAAAAIFDDKDLAQFPCPIDEMRNAYLRVSTRIGVSTADLAKPIRRVLLRHTTIGDDGLKLEPAKNAVLSVPTGDRQECVHCGLCLWGCARRSIYNSAYELPDLQRFPNFHYQSGNEVRSVLPASDGHALELANTRRIIVAPYVLLAAGTIATTALALRRLQTFGRDVRLFSNPVATLAFIIPAEFGASLPERGFSLGQLRYTMMLEDGTAVSGLFYTADTLPLGLIADRLPFSRPVALRCARALAPSLVLVTCYLPGAFSRNTLRLENRKTGRVVITGEQPADTRGALVSAGRQLARHMWRRGAYKLPGSLTFSDPGSDAHYAGTLPIGSNGPLGCSPDGELNACRHLYIVDGACLPVLPAQHCTLTIMANAERIARHLANRLHQ